MPKDKEELNLSVLSDGDDEEEQDVEEYVAAVLTQMVEQGIPVFFTNHPADPFIPILLKRLHRQNDHLAEISASLRDIAIKIGATLLPRIDLPKK